MKLTLLFVALVLSGASHAQGVSKLECDARDEAGAPQRLVADLTKKIYLLVDARGKESAVFDANTICGWKPSAGLANVTCPLAAQTGPNGYVAVDLRCDKAYPTQTVTVTTGSLQARGGTGHLICSVRSTVRLNLDLSNCRLY